MVLQCQAFSDKNGQVKEHYFLANILRLNQMFKNVFRICQLSLCKIVWLWVSECDTTLGSFNTFNIDLFDRILQMVCPGPRLITLTTLLSHNHGTITSHSLIPSAFPSVHKIFQHFILMSMSRDGLQNTPDKKATIKSLYKELPPFLVGDTLQIVK